MTYKTVQTGVADVIKKLTDYSATNVSVDDYRILGHGKMKAVVLRRGPATREAISFGSPVTIQNLWSVLGELYVPFQGERDTQADSVIVEAQTIIDELDKWPQLDAVSGVVDAEAQALGQPEEWLLGRSRWWRQVIEVGIVELVAVTLSE